LWNYGADIFEDAYKAISDTATGNEVGNTSGDRCPWACSENPRPNERGGQRCRRVLSEFTEDSKTLWECYQNSDREGMDELDESSIRVVESLDDRDIVLDDLPLRNIIRHPDGVSQIIKFKESYKENERPEKHTLEMEWRKS
jgi:hypothetical protein